VTRHISIDDSVSGARVLVEICVDTIAGVAAAIDGGAGRIELCSALALGGLTPSAGLTVQAVAMAQRSGVAVHAMVRPRDGGFCFGDHDWSTTLVEAEALVAAGVDGLVFGASLADGEIDGGRLASWCAAIERIATLAGRPIHRVLHRAIDLAPDPVGAVDQAIAAGFDSVLSSGGATDAVAGAATLARMVARAQGRCRIIAGAGVRPDNVAALIRDTGVDAVHASASIAVAEPQARVVARGFGGSVRRHTDADTVRALVRAVAAVPGQGNADD
jgi:copper homeostasis protein